MEVGRTASVSISRTAPVIDSRIERQILTGLIISDQFCQFIQPLWRGDALQLPYSRVIGQWCQGYYEKYRKSPGRNIQDLFLNNSHTLKPDDAEAVRDFLASISDEHERSQAFNWEYCRDQAELYFRMASISRLREDMMVALTAGRPEDAENLITRYVRPAIPESKGCNPITNIDSILQAFQAREANQLFKLPGVMGKMVGPISRGELVAIVGPSGVGKTWWLISMALIAVFRGFNVIFFSYEMPRDQIVRRVQHILTGLPREDGKVLIPVWDCVLNQSGACSIQNREGRRGRSIRLLGPEGQRPDYEYAPKDYVPCCACRGTRDPWYTETWYREEERVALTEGEIIKKHQTLTANVGGRSGEFHVAACPSGQHSVGDVRTYIKNREYYEGITTDLIITDSADKMRVEARYDDHRHGIYSIWMGHKALSEELHAGVLTVSHSNTERTGKRIKQGDWAEDIRKLRESDAAFALNQSPIDQTAGRYVTSMLKLRDEKFEQNRNVVVLSCLDIGKPYLDSAYEHVQNKGKEKPAAARNRKKESQ